MKIAELTILENITNNELMSLLGNPEQSINVSFKDTQGKEVLFDIAPLFREQNQLAGVLKKTFDFADYQLNKDGILFTVLPNDNQFTLKASKLIDADDSTETVESHKVLLKVSTNTGNIVGKIIDIKEFIIDIADKIPAEIKAELKKTNIKLTGTKWNDFTVNGKAKIEFQQVDENTVFVGNKNEGFLTS